MNKWKTLPLKDCMAAIIDYRGKTPTKTTSGIPLITAKIVKNGRIDEPSEFIDPADYDLWMTRGLPELGDIVLTTEAPLGEVAQLDGRKVALAQRIITLRGKSGTLDNKYLKYVLQSDYVKSQLLGRASGSTVSGIKQSELRKVQLPLPPIDEQEAIGSTLGALDDKIDLNRRMNETLEQTARALFKDWFVDFGPTKAKMAGQAAYLEGDLWDLFPERLDEAGVPEGWQMGIIGDVADAPRTGVDPLEVEADTPYIGLEHMPRRTISLSDWEGAGKVTSSKSAFQRGDFLFGKLRPYFHKVGVAPLDGICSTDIVVIRTPKPEWRAFTIACISSDEFVSYTDRTSTGTKMPRTSWKIMAQFEISIPSVSLAEAYNSVCWPMIERIEANIHESRTLAQTRDLLLPKLMSGELRVYDAEELVQEVV